MFWIALLLYFAGFHAVAKIMVRYAPPLGTSGSDWREIGIMMLYFFGSWLTVLLWLQEYLRIRQHATTGL
jgi:hypothetical protein